MKRNSLIPALILIALLLAMILPGCQNTTPPDSTPTITELLETESVMTATNAPVSTETAETEPIETEAESIPATEAPTEALTEPTTEAPAETSPTEPKPTEPAPTETKPYEPQPTEPKPTEPKPTEPAPTEPKPTEPKPTEPPHTHSWSGWTQTTAPTCGAAGEETRTCNCGAKETRPVAATGNHSWTETSPTCTQDGSKTCSVCGKLETLNALGHAWVHHDEEGHWQGSLICYCGEVFYSTADWDAHASAYPYDLDYLDAHAGYRNGPSEWIVDKAAYDVCSRCGATK